MRRGGLIVAVCAMALAAAAPAQAAPRGCDPLDPAACLLPWPNDYFRERPDVPPATRLALAE